MREKKITFAFQGNKIGNPRLEKRFHKNASIWPWNTDRWYKEMYGFKKKKQHHELPLLQRCGHFRLCQSNFFCSSPLTMDNLDELNAWHN